MTHIRIMKTYHCHHHDTPRIHLVKSVGLKVRRSVKCLVQDVRSQEMRSLTILLRSLTFAE